MADYPHDNHRFCAVADEGRDRIYTVGGVHHKNHNYYYTVSTNSWTGIQVRKTGASIQLILTLVLQGLKKKSYDGACGIITQRSSGHRYLVLICSTVEQHIAVLSVKVVPGRTNNWSQYFDLTAWSGWHNFRDDDWIKVNCG